MTVELALAAHIYHIEAPFAPWLCPGLAVCGVALQIAAIFLKKRVTIAAGFVLVACGTIPDSDLTLFTGDLLASLALWRILK